MAEPRAQAERRIDVRVSFVAGRSAFIDKGRDAKIQVGDGVVLRAPGGARVKGEVVAVSSKSSRVALPEMHGITLGATGTVHVRQRSSAARDKATPGKRSVRQPMQHPPWTRPLAPQSADDPLLHTVYGRGPAARPVQVDGRAYANLLVTRDRGSGRSSRYVLGRVGTDVSARNLAGYGGVFHFDGEATRRETHLRDADDSRSTRGRIDRLSYVWGEEQTAPVRVEVGRFLLRESTELGILDGVEVMVPSAEHDQFGFSFGALPEPTAALSSGADVVATTSYRHVFDEDQVWSTRLGFSKSWHRGAPDRDLFLASVDFAPGDGTFAHANAWVDFYDSHDKIKARGFQVTQLQLQGGGRLSDDVGVTAALLHFRFPELRRREYVDLPPELIRNNRMTRVDLSFWEQASDSVRLDQRVYHWDDQDGNGNGGDLRVSARDWLFERGNVSLSLFWNEASDFSGPGFHLRATRWFGETFATLGYRYARYKFDSVARGNPYVTQQDLDAALDFDLSEQVSASVSLDYGFGDGQDSVTLGFFLQTRF